MLHFIYFYLILVDVACLMLIIFHMANVTENWLMYSAVKIVIMWLSMMGWSLIIRPNVMGIELFYEVLGRFIFNPLLSVLEFWAISEVSFLPVTSGMSKWFCLCNIVCFDKYATGVSGEVMDILPTRCPYCIYELYR